MAEMAPPAVKKARRSAPASRVSAEERAKQFKDLYANGGVLFCSYCDHSVDYVHIDTIKDHLKSKKHCQQRASKQSKAATSGPSTSRQVTLQSAVKSKDLREEFVLNAFGLFTHVDIPLHKVEKMCPFLQKYCKQAGSLPQLSTLRKVYVPRLFEFHFAALTDILQNQPHSITADETTDVRDHSILNVLATVHQ